MTDVAEALAVVEAVEVVAGAAEVVVFDTEVVEEPAAFEDVAAEEVALAVVFAAAVVVVVVSMVVVADVVVSVFSLRNASMDRGKAVINNSSLFVNLVDFGEPMVKLNGIFDFLISEKSVHSFYSFKSSSHSSNDWEGATDWIRYTDNGNVYHDMVQQDDLNDENYVILPVERKVLVRKRG